MLGFPELGMGPGRATSESLGRRFESYRAHRSADGYRRLQKSTKPFKSRQLAPLTAAAVRGQRSMGRGRGTLAMRKRRAFGPEEIEVCRVIFVGSAA